MRDGSSESHARDVIHRIVNTGPDSRIAGLSVNNVAAEAGPVAKRPRIADLNTLPSPYISGVFDDLFDDRYNFHAVWETNRGCPYACTFCDWGSATMSKVRTFPEDRLQKEIDWFADHRIQWIYGADANFGILPRDETIAEWLAATARARGEARLW